MPPLLSHADSSTQAKTTTELETDTFSLIVSKCVILMIGGALAGKYDTLTDGTDAAKVNSSLMCSVLKSSQSTKWIQPRPN